MNPLLSVLGLAIAASLLIYRYIISPIVSPLSRIPSPNPLCYIADYLIHYLAWRKQEFDWLLKQHRRHGPLIRIGPTAVSVNSVEGLRQVYTSLEKPDFYTQFASYKGTPNMFSTPDHPRHSVQKRILSGVFAKSYLQRSEDIRKIFEDVFDERLAPVLRHLADTRRPVNVFQLFQFLGLDLFTAYAFGLDKSTRFIQNHGHENRLYDAGNPRSVYESKDRRDQSWLSEEECLALCKEAARGIDEKTIRRLDKLHRPRKAVLVSFRSNAAFISRHRHPQVCERDA